MKMEVLTEGADNDGDPATSTSSFSVGYPLIFSDLVMSCSAAFQQM
jgi:hypothetical protein